MSRNNADAHFSTTSSTATRREADGEWRDEHGKPIAGGAAGNAAAVSAAAAAASATGAPAEVVRVEKITKTTTVKAVPDTDRHDSAYTAGVTGGVSGGARTDTYSSSATAGGRSVGGAADHRDTAGYSSTTTSAANRNVSGQNRSSTHDYSPERRRDVVSGSTTNRVNYNQHDTNEVRQRGTGAGAGGYGNERETTSTTTTRGVRQEGGVYQPETRGQTWNERQEDTHGWRAERLSEDQQLEGSGKPMMLDAVAGTRNTRVAQQPYGYRREVQQTTTYGQHQQIAGQDVNSLLKYLLLIPLALLVPLFLASLIGIPLLGSLIPFAKIFPFLKFLGKHRHHTEVEHSRLHKGYKVQPSALFEDTTARSELYCVPIAWEHLLKTQKWYDVVLVANDNTQVYAHKVVLAARSPVLEREIDVLMSRGTKERSNTDVVGVCTHEAPCKLTLKNLDGKLLKNFVEFLYSGRVADRNRIEDLMAVGQAFEVPDLQDAAAEELIYNLDASTAGDALILGHDYGHCGLRKAAKLYIRDNWKTVHGNSYYKRAMNRRPSILSDDYVHSDREERVCHLVNRH